MRALCILSLLSTVGPYDAFAIYVLRKQIVVPRRGRSVRWRSTHIDIDESFGACYKAAIEHRLRKIPVSLRLL